MGNDIAIKVSDVYKSFRVYNDRGYSFKEMILFSQRRKYENHDVIKGISFDVQRGEAIGLVGHNGCGKSTMLKMLTRIMYPDKGKIEIKGRVSSLIELGAGFHPDMSGRENIYTNASIFGLSKAEIDERIQSIIDFSEIEEFIDNPVRTYSSGMYMRLAFAVAINVNADVLLIDEILAVGDVAFQNKCFNRLKEIKANGTTIVIVSHSLGQIEQICDRSIWINDGVIAAEGNPKAVHMSYLEYMVNKQKAAEKAVSQVKKENPEPAKNEQPQKHDEAKPQNQQTVKQPDPPAEKPQDPAVPKKRWGSKDAVITSISIRSADGEERRTFSTNEDIVIELAYEVKTPVHDAVFGIGIFNRDGVQCYGTNTRIDRLPEFSLEKSGRLILKLSGIPLLAGEYLLDFAIEQGQGIPVDYYREAAVITIASNIGDAGITRIPHEWDLSC